MPMEPVAVLLGPVPLWHGVSCCLHCGPPGLPLWLCTEELFKSHWCVGPERCEDIMRQQTMQGCHSGTTRVSSHRGSETKWLW